MNTLRAYAILQFKDIRFFLLAVFIANMGSQMQTVAINWHMYELTHSPLSLGLIGLVGFLPIFFFSLINGTLVDKVNRKYILILAQLLVAVSSLFLFFATFLHMVTPLVIYIIVAVNAFLSTINIPARQAMLPSVVPQKYFINAFSLNSSSWQAGVVLGPMVGGFVIALFGVQAVYIANALFYLVGIVFLINIHYVSNHIKQGVSFSIQSIMEGVHFVLRTPLIYSTMLVDFFATFFASSLTLMPIFAKDILQVGPQGLGFLYSAPAVGSVLAGFIIASRHHIKKQGLFLLIGVCIYGIATVLFGTSKIFLLSLIFLAISGVGDTMSAVIRNTIRQLLTPDHLRGRMTAINMNFFVGGPFLGETEAGITANLFGAPASVVLGGVATVVLTVLVAIFVPKMRKYESEAISV